MTRRSSRPPRPVQGLDWKSLPLNALEGYVLSRIDGSSTVEDLADVTALPVEQVQAILEHLAELGAVEFASSKAPTHPPRQPSSRPSDGPTGVFTRPKSEESASVPAPPQVSVAPPAAPPVVELPPERIAKIDTLFPKLDTIDHYSILGLTPEADVKAIRAAYFGLSKVFHPDTAFRKNLGPYKARMEAIFKRLTEAYEVLGKKKSRAEYDAYIALQGFTRSAEAAIESPVSVPSPPESEPLSSRTSQSMSEEGRKRARELLEMRLRRGRSDSGTPPPTSRSLPIPPPTSRSLPIPPPTSGSRDRGEVLRELTSSLKGAAAQTGGFDAVQRHLLEAKRRERDDDLAGAARELRLALALAPDRLDIADEKARVSQRLASELADRYRQQAEYEERHKKWAAAAISWSKVVEGRPNDMQAKVHAAQALLEAKGDLHEAQRLALLACEDAPHDLSARILLGRVYLAAGLRLNAKRELERALIAAPDHPTIKSLLLDL